MATFNTSKYSGGSFYDNIKAGIESGAYTSKEKPAKYIFVTNKRGRRVKKINPKWTAWNKKQENKKTEEQEKKKKSTPIKRLSKEERKKHETIAKNERLRIKKTEANKKGNEKAKGSTNTGGPVKSGVEYAKSKGDDLAGYRRTKDTRITKNLKKAGFTEDRLARLRKEHAEWKAKRKKKKKK